MNTPYGESETWFLTGSQGLYGEDVLRQVQEQSRRGYDALVTSPEVPVVVIAKPVLTDAESIRRMLLEASTSDAGVGVIAIMHTFSPGQRRRQHGVVPLGGHRRGHRRTRWNQAYHRLAQGF